MGVMGWAA
jgi:hypothetical protein